ncbi:MAG: hypothetical protein M1457_07480, partial [bacterium]|nr:hypothetical protein [bacterium]
GEGIVRSLDAAAGKVFIDFPGQPERPMTSEGVRKYLKYIEPAHFLARRAKSPESLYKMGETDPVELVKLVLTGQEGREIRQADLKTLLLGGVIPADEWNGWWARTREGLKLDPYIDFDAGGGARALIGLREEPRTFEQEIEEGFFAEDATPSLRAELIRQVARRPKESPLPLALVRRMDAALAEQWELAAGDNPVVRLEIAYMREDLAAAAPEAGIDRTDDAPLLTALTDYDALFAIDNVDYGIRALNKLLARDGEEGRRRAAQLLPRAPVKLAQAIWRALVEEAGDGREARHEQAVAALRALFANPLANVETFAWAVRATLGGAWVHLAEDFPAAALVPDLLDDMETWQKIAADGPKEESAAARALLSRMRTLLAADRFDVFEILAHSFAGHGTLGLAGKVDKNLAGGGVETSDNAFAPVGVLINLTGRQPHPALEGLEGLGQRDGAGEAGEAQKFFEVIEVGVKDLKRTNEQRAQGFGIGMERDGRQQQAANEPGIAGVQSLLGQ